MTEEINQRKKRILAGEVPCGYILKEDKVIPEGWDYSPMKSRIDVFRGASPRPKGDPRFYGGPIPRLMIQDVTRDGKITYPQIDSLTEEGAKKSRYLPCGSLVLSCSGTKVGIPGILGIDACIHDGFFGFRLDERTETEFLYYYFEYFHNQMQSSATKGGVFNNLTTDIMKNHMIPFPTVPEQQKIASILSTWDKAIELKEQLIEEKKKQKSGLMQKLLTGKVRLPGFEGEWEKIKFSKVLDFVKREPVENPNDYYLLTVKLHLKGVEPTNKKPKLTEKGRPYYIRNPREIIIGRQNFHNGGIAIIPEDIVGYVASNAISSLVAVNGNLDFLYYYISEPAFYKKVGHLIGGTGQKEISESMLKDLALFIPKEIKEQEAISELISLADNNIKLLEMQLSNLKLQKKGLMQLLLTGIVRVQC